MKTLEQQDIKLRALLGGGVQASKNLQSLMEVSQATLSRIIQRNKESILTLGAARSTKYALLHPLREFGAQIPIYQVNETGNVYPLGELYLLASSQYGWREPNQSVDLVDSLPYFLQSMRPEGFMGRAFAHRMADEFGLPRKLQDWNDRHVLTALCLRGEDVSGNLIVGFEAAQRYVRQARSGQERNLRPEERPEAFESYAQAAISGEAWGSSAGGEQPKFTALVEGQRVLVKFASNETQEGQRWCDLLVCEHIADKIITSAGVRAATTEIIQTESWTFLQSARFDRSGMWGRTPLVSLGVVDAEFFGEQDNWISASERLNAEQLISPADAEHLRWLSTFGTFIGNTDQHFGNASLIPGEDWKSFTLSPAYDMGPMFYRPRTGGSLPLDPINPESMDVPNETEDDARQWAVRFWSCIESDGRISESFRTICQDNISALEEMASGPRFI